MEEKLIEIVKDVGELLIKNFGKVNMLKKIRIKSVYDYSIVADLLAEKEILKKLKEAKVKCKVITEERGEINLGNSEKLLFIDPLDGTLNYSKGIPHFCTSIAMEEGDEVTLGIIYDPCRKELFLAEKNKGAFLNGKRIKVNKCKSLKDSFCSIGFDYGNFEKSMKIEEKIREVVRRVRIFGCAGLDFSWVACGRLEGYVDLDLKPWDLVAGAFLVEEAGGEVTDIKGNPWHPYYKEIVATNKVIHKNLLKVINE
jgi:myo-inositol-1(or 4)-monophosphatase